MKKLIFVIILILGIVLCALSFKAFNTSKNDSKQNTNETKIEISRSSFQLPIENRNYKIGLSGYTPTNFPNQKAQDSTNFWNDINLYSEVYGVHVDWKDTRVLEIADNSIDQDISLVLGFQNPSEWISKKQEYISKAKELLKENQKIKYLAIGNEVNILFENNPTEFQNFIDSYFEIYDSIKKDFPEVKIYTVFQYEYLKGDGYLSGKKDIRNPQFDLLNKFEQKLDLIGLTTYPYFDFTSPSEIPNDYFLEIRNYSNKPLAITETGWMSRTAFGGKNSEISRLGYAGSELEQSDYLKKLTQILDSDSVEFLNWFPLNDISNWQDADEGVAGFELFDSIGLRKNDGTKKPVFDLWIELKTI